jgi:hypothetical protein
MVRAEIDYENEQVLVYTYGQQTLHDIGKPLKPYKFAGFKELDINGATLITFLDGPDIVVSKADKEMILQKVAELNFYQTNTKKQA